jgi:PiT family inorganic phosphate transporter
MSVELIVLIILALAFDYVNGFHDAANAIATTVSTRALSPRNAVIVAWIFNFVGAMVSTKVAATIGKGVINPGDQHTAVTIILVALIGAIIWDLITWYFGLPSSSTHALVGGMMGVGLVAIGTGCLQWKGLSLVLIAMVLSPVFGILAGMLCVSILYWLFRHAHPSSISRNFRLAQMGSAVWMSFSHGMNDAQNAMGIITIGLLAGGKLSHFEVPFWVKLCCGIAMAAGTSMGGWRIIKTMGQSMVDLKPIDGFAAELATGSATVGMSLIGAPISTTHVVSTSIMGTGAAKNITSVRWNVVKRIVGAWVFTIPGAALISAICWWIKTLLEGFFK